MAEPFKNLINADAVGAIGHHLHRVWTGFDPRTFTWQALAGLDTLERKARVMQAAGALVAALPADVDRAAGILEASLGPAGAGDDLAGLRTSAAGLAGWPVWPLSEAITLLAARQHPARGLQALHAMTQRLTAAFAIRPFLMRHPAIGFATLARWVHGPRAHVCRLVSEGSRPRLPWGLRLLALAADPAPTLPLLARRQDDASGCVRRSLANHPNDIAKDQPARVTRWPVDQLPGASAERSALLRRASPTLIKQGDAAVLAAWGLGTPFCGHCRLGLSASRRVVGALVTLQIDLHSHARHPQKLVIDDALRHVKARGGSSAKVLQGRVIDPAPGERRQLEKRHSFKPVSTRRLHAGPHRTALRINGQVHAGADFELHR